MTRPRPIAPLLALSIFSAFPGCAVLTIDVDVYKGPLANEDEVLVEQTVVLAKAAEPILKRLKDHLQNFQPWRAGYNHSQSPDRGSPHRDMSLAAIVELLLSLYDDVPMRYQAAVVLVHALDEYVKTRTLASTARASSSGRAGVPQVFATMALGAQRAAESAVKDFKTNLEGSEPELRDLTQQMEGFFDKQPKDANQYSLSPLEDDSARKIAHFELQVREALANWRVGRYPDGLNTCIDRYLQEAHEDPKLREARGINDRVDPVLAARSGLLDCLTQFAERLQFLAGIEPLLPDEGAEETTRHYMTLLQAIGNTILYQVDSIRNREHYVGTREAAARIEQAGRHKSTAPENGTDDKHEDPKDVLDMVIVQLRYELLDEVKEHGDSEKAKSIRLALQAAIEHRSGMVYLRPASSYLRTSYLTTYVQDDSPVTWSNMLEDQWWRQVPLLGELMERGGLKRGQILQQIDKQYWQNVNRVRLAGGGTTNYVVAKDDVGNWYVKNYSSDPKRIIKSAKNLATFAAGGLGGSSVMSRAALLNAKPPSDLTDEQIGFLSKYNQEQENGSLLRRMRESIEKRAQQKTLEAYEALRLDWASLRSVLEEEVVGADETNRWLFVQAIWLVPVDPPSLPPSTDADAHGNILKAVEFARRYGEAAPARFRQSAEMAEKATRALSSAAAVSPRHDLPRSLAEVHSILAAPGDEDAWRHALREFHQFFSTILDDEASNVPIPPSDGVEEDSLSRLGNKWAGRLQAKVSDRLASRYLDKLKDILDEEEKELKSLLRNLPEGQ